MGFWILTDVCCDLPADYIKEQEQFWAAPMPYRIDNEDRDFDLLEENLDQKLMDFFQRLSDGATSVTSQVNQQTWMDKFTQICEAGEDILVLAFSSALSGTYASALAAAGEISPKYPNSKIYVVDSLCASLGEGLFLRQVLAHRDGGHTIEECRDYAEDIKQKVIHWFTVDDLHFLRRGGRVSSATAYIGSMLKIKPVMNVNPEGKLIPRDKVQGRKRSLSALYEKAKQYAFEPEKQTMLISHGNCTADAEWLAEKLKKELNVPEVIVSLIGPIVGSHSGPGTVALFFMGKDGEGRLS